MANESGAEQISALSVLHVVTLISDDGAFGGPVSVATAQARELERRGHRVNVTGLGRGDVRVPPGLSAERWVLHPARRLVPGAGMLGLFNAGLIRYLWVTLRTVDVVHVHAGRDLVSLAALLVARIRRIPVVAQTHGMVLPRRHLRARVFDPLFLRLLRRVRTVLFMTPGEETDLRSQLGATASLTFLGNGVEVLAPEPRTPPGRPTVLFLARLHPVKGVMAFAEMAALLVHRGVDAEFVVHGPDQGELEKLEAMIVREHLEGVLEYRGALDHEAATTAVADAAVYVLPSSADWMPMSLIEALAAGTPSVCTSSCGLAPALQAAAAGRVTDGSPTQLADAVEAIVTQPDEWLRLSRAGRALVQDSYSVETVVDRLVEIYRDAVSPSATSAATRLRPAADPRRSRA